MANDPWNPVRKAETSVGPLAILTLEYDGICRYEGIEPIELGTASRNSVPTDRPAGIMTLRG